MKKPTRLRLVFGSSLIVSGLVVAAFLVALPLISQPAAAAVGIGVTGGCTQTATNTATCTITMSGSLTSGRTVVVGVGTPGARTVSGITGGGTYSKRSSVLNTVDAEMWSTTVGGGTGGTSSVVITMSGNGRFVAWATEYTGVLFFGPTAITNTGSTANPTVSYTLDDASDWLLAMEVGTGTAPTAGTGNLRDARATTGVDSGYVDNTAASATSVTASTTHSATAWAIAGLELVIASGCTRAPTVALGGGQTQIIWSPATGTEGPDMPTGESSGTPMVTLTNKGPGSCGLGISRQSGTPPTGVEDQWSATNSAPNSGTNDITTSNAVVCAGVAEGGTCQIWLWTRFTNFQASGSGGQIFTGTYVWTEA